MTRILNLKAAAFVAVIGAAAFLYANQSTIAARFNSITAPGAESSVIVAPSVVDERSADPLLW